MAGCALTDFERLRGWGPGGGFQGVAPPVQTQHDLYESTNMNNPGSYTASKSGLLGITRWLSTILSPSIRVNMISPGGVYRGQEDIFVKKYIERVPLKKFCREEDVSNLVLFLASKESAYITGQNFLLDGGFTSW